MPSMWMVIREDDKKKGDAAEARVLKALNEWPMPDFVKGATKAPYVEDHQGIDIIVKVKLRFPSEQPVWVDAEMFLQIKCSTASSGGWEERYRTKGIRVIVAGEQVSDAQLAKNLDYQLRAGYRWLQDTSFVEEQKEPA